VAVTWEDHSNSRYERTDQKQELATNFVDDGYGREAVNEEDTPVTPVADRAEKWYSHIVSTIGI
jgi:hypothetical protein